MAGSQQDGAAGQASGGAEGTNTQGSGTGNAQNGNGRGRGGNNSNHGGNYMKHFKGEVPEVGAVLGTGTEQRDMKDRYQNFIDKLVSYVLRSTAYPNARDIKSLLTDMTDIRARLASQMPAAPSPTTDDKGNTVAVTDTKKQYHQIKLKAFVERENHLENNIYQLYKLIWGQLSQALQNRVKRENEWKKRRDGSDVEWLLRTIKRLAANVDHMNNTYKSAIVCMRALLGIKQGKNESVDNYRKRFEGIVDTLSIIGLKDIFRQTDFARENANGDLDKAEEALAAMCFFLGADPARFGSLFSKMDTDVLLGNDHYPTDIGGAFDVLCRYHRPCGRRDGGPGTGARPQQHYNFLQAEEGTDLCAGADGQITERDGRYPCCYNCNKLGHLANNCPDPPRRGGTQSVIVRHSLSQGTVGSYVIDPNWILLDTCSTVTSFMNPKLLTDVHDCAPGEEMKVLANGNGEQDYFQKGTDTYLSLPTYLNTESIANIVSMADATKKYRVTMDTESHGTCIFVHLADGKTMKFKECGQGLYYFDTDQDKLGSPNTTNNEVTNYSFVSTVKANKRFFSKQEVTQADRARLLQQILDWPSSVKLKKIVSNNQLRNCPVTASDVDRADAIYGPAVPICKGKMIRQKPKHYKAIPHIPLPLNLIAEHQTADIYMDFFYVNGKPFLHTKCKPQDFLTIDKAKTRGLTAVKQHLDSLKQTFEGKGFQVRGFHGDNEFRPLIEYYSPTPVHITAAGEHNGVIERSIRTVEERARCTCHGVPFPKVPHVMIEHLLLRIAENLNAFPTDTGISANLSPSSIILQTLTLDYNNISLPYGAYCQAYTRTDNSMRTRSIGAIALRPSNERGGFYFMSLNTGRLVHAFIWKELPIDDHVIDRVVLLAENEGAPLMNNGPIFEWHAGVPVLADDIDLVLFDDEDQSFADDTSYTPSLESADIALDEDFDFDYVEDIGDLHLQAVDDPDGPDPVNPNPDQGANLPNPNVNVNLPPAIDATTDDDDDDATTDDDDDNANTHDDDDDTHDNDDANEQDTDDNNESSDSDEESSSSDESGDDADSENRNQGANERPRRKNAGQGVPRLEPQIGGKTYNLKSKTNFVIKPVPGQLPSRTFLNGLAFRTFFCTPYVRHHSMPLYTPKPDICHELLGHVPMLTNAEFCDFSQEIGIASLGASDEDIVKLARCYWFSVEFGLCREGSEVKAFGAGLLSSFGELRHVCENQTHTRPELKAWDARQASLQEHPLTSFQPLYFVADSFTSLKESFKAFCDDIKQGNDLYTDYSHESRTLYAN